MRQEAGAPLRGDATQASAARRRYSVDGLGRSSPRGGRVRQGAGAGETWSRGRQNAEQGPHVWGCDRGAGQGASIAGLRASAGSHPRGNPVPPSDAPTCGDATVEPAETRRPPALARLRGHIPEGTLFRPPTRPLRGDATQASAARRRYSVGGLGRSSPRGGRVRQGAGARRPSLGA